MTWGWFMAFYGIGLPTSCVIPGYVFVVHIDCNLLAGKLDCNLMNTSAVERVDGCTSSPLAVFLPEEHAFLDPQFEHQRTTNQWLCHWDSSIKPNEMESLPIVYSSTNQPNPWQKRWGSLHATRVAWASLWVPSWISISVVFSTPLRHLRMRITSE